MTTFDSIVPRAETLVLVFNLVVAVTLICGAGLTADRFLRNRSAPLRYGLLASALVLSLSSPTMALLFGQFGGGPLRWMVAAPLADSSGLARTGEPATERPSANRRPQKADADSKADSPASREERPRPDAVAPFDAEHDARKLSATARPTTGGGPPGGGSSELFPHWWQTASAVLLGAWGMGAVIAFTGLVRGWLAVCRLRRTLEPPGDLRVARLAARAAKALGLHRGPPVFESAHISVPVSLGPMRPAIVLPEDLGWELDDRQLESVLLHETAHIVHRDHLVGLAGRLASAMFWWHPLVHRMNRRLADLREDICDNHVVRQQGDSRGYARVLVDLAARTALRPALPAAIGLLENEFGGIEGRVRRLLQDDRNTETRLSLRAIAALAMFVSLLAGALFVSNVRAERAFQEQTAALQPLAIVTVKTRDELIRALHDAKPGTKVLIAPGGYEGGLTFANLHGEKDKPIVLAAADPKDPPVISGGASGLHLIDPHYVELHDLVVVKARADGLNIDDGGSYDTPAHHVVLRGLAVRDIGSNGNHDGIKLSGVDDFVVENCTVERWGKAGSGIDMVGCHNGVVSGGTFRAGDKALGNAVQTKGGSRGIAVSGCRFESAGGRAVNIGGSTGLAYFRPKPQGYEAKDITVSDCTFIGSMAPIAFAGVDGAHVHHNTIYRPTRWVMRILQENQDAEFVPCRNGRFANNIVVFRSDELAYPVNIGDKTSPESFEFAENFWHCLDRPEKTRRTVQLPTAEKDGTYGEDPMFQNADEGDLRLAAGSPAKNHGPRESATIAAPFRP